MFAAIAGSYDLNNRLHSLWQDQAWRRIAVRSADCRAGDVVVDVACGTGDLSRLFATAKPAPSVVIGIDYTREMLDVAEVTRQRVERTERSVRDQQNARPSSVASVASQISYIEGDAQRLPLADSSADIISIAFGIRNVQSPPEALAEFYRVLKPGGRLVILEFDTPTIPVVKQLSTFYTGWVMPRTATLIAGDSSGAYKYLPASVATFMNQHQLQAAITEAGFAEASRKSLSLGVCICHRAIKR